jgi:hypothetical protein
VNCCNCKCPVELGPEYIPEGSEWEKRDDLAVRCVYCLTVFCAPCATQHFEARNGGKVQKRVVVETKVVEEWREVPPSAWKDTQ